MQVTPHVSAKQMTRSGSGTQANVRATALWALLVLPLAVLFLAAGPIAQDPAYHAFADSRALLGMAHFGNVVSNLGFLVVGAMGLRLCLHSRVAGAARSWTVFFTGTLLVSIGSGYYHLTPGDAALVWDRLPMTIAFMALFVALVSEHVRSDLEGRMLAAAIAVGIASIAWWRFTGDLRVYVWVQFTPLVAIPIVMAAYPGRYTHRSYLLYGLACYALAKAAELADTSVFAATGGVVSGHTLKHLLAALAPLFVYFMLRVRQPRMADRAVSR